MVEERGMSMVFEGGGRMKFFGVAQRWGNIGRDAGPCSRDHRGRGVTHQPSATELNVAEDTLTFFCFEQRNNN